MRGQVGFAGPAVSPGDRRWTTSNPEIAPSRQRQGFAAYTTVDRSSICRTRGQAFVAYDRALDRQTSGPLWLRQPQIADLVADAILIAE